MSIIRFFLLVFIFIYFIIYIIYYIIIILYLLPLPIPFPLFSTGHFVTFSAPCSVHVLGSVCCVIQLVFWLYWLPDPLQNLGIWTISFQFPHACSPRTRRRGTCFREKKFLVRFRTLAVKRWLPQCPPRANEVGHCPFPLLSLSWMTSKI